MAAIGSFGPLIFEVSAGRVHTYSELNESATANWANHEVMGGPPVSEFLGPSQDQLSLKIVFTPNLGVEPDESYALCRDMARTGQHYPFIVDGMPLSDNEWYIESLSSASSTFSARDGSVLWMECTIELREYN